MRLRFREGERGLLLGGMPVADHHCGQALGALLQVLHDAVFGDGVDGGGGGVENKERRVTQDRAGQGDALALATGKSQSAFPDHRVESAKIGHEAIRARDPERFENLLIGGLAAQADVLADAGREEKGLVGHQNRAGIVRHVQQWQRGAIGQLRAEITGGLGAQACEGVGQVSFSGSWAAHDHGGAASGNVHVYGVAIAGIEGAAEADNGVAR